MVFSGRAATGGGAASRSASSVDTVAAGDDDLYAFYIKYTFIHLSHTLRAYSIKRIRIQINSKSRFGFTWPIEYNSNVK